MKNLFHGRLLPLVLALCLSGCGSPEDRINAAIPVDAEVVTAHEAIAAMAGDQSDAVGKIEEEYRARLKVRALTCAPGYAPSMFTSKGMIRVAAGNASCFADADKVLAKWLALRRIGLMLALPALRELPKTPPALLSGKAS